MEYQTALRTSAAKATEELFGDGAGEALRKTTIEAHVSHGAAEPATPSTVNEDVVPQDKEGLEPSRWRAILQEHVGDAALPKDLQAKVKLALNPNSQTTDAKGESLASAVADCINAQQS